MVIQQPVTRRLLETLGQSSTCDKWNLWTLILTLYEVYIINFIWSGEQSPPTASNELLPTNSKSLGRLYQGTLPNKINRLTQQTVPRESLEETTPACICPSCPRVPVGTPHCCTAREEPLPFIILYKLLKLLFLRCFLFYAREIAWISNFCVL